MPSTTYFDGCRRRSTVAPPLAGDVNPPECVRPERMLPRRRHDGQQEAENKDDSSGDIENDYILVEQPDVAEACAAPPRQPPQCTARFHMRFIPLPDDHELAFDFFSGVPTLYARRRRSSLQQQQQQQKPSPAQAAGLPSWIDLGPSPTGGGCLHFLFWARPGDEPGAVMPVLGASGPRLWRYVKDWMAEASLISGLIRDVINNEKCPERPRFFTFSPGMVVLYERPGEDNHGELLIFGQDYYTLSPRAAAIKGEEEGNRLVIRALTPNTGIF